MNGAYGTPEWVAWLAGILDGEGWIGIAQGARPLSRVGHGGVYHSPGLQLANTSLPMLERAASVIEAITGQRPPIHRKVDNSADRAGHRPAWVIRLTARAPILLLLSATRAYLVAKDQQADLLMAFLRRHAALPWSRRRTDATYRADQIDFDRLRLLNGRPDDAETLARLEQMLGRQEGDHRVSD